MMNNNNNSCEAGSSTTTVLDNNQQQPASTVANDQILDHPHQQQSSSTSPSSPPPKSPSSTESSNQNETRILYHIDEEETPYLVRLSIPTANIKLKDFKAAISLPRPHYKFFFKSYDKEVGMVKEEIFDDNAILPTFKNRIFAWLVSTEGSTISDSTNSQCQTEISATGRLAGPYNRNNNNNSAERNGLIGDSHPPSFHGSVTDHCGQTITETESMISSRNGGTSHPHHNHHHHHSNSRRGWHKSGNHKYAAAVGNRYGSNSHHGAGGSAGNGSYYYHHQQHQHHAHDHSHHHSNYMDSSVLTSDMESTSFVNSDDDDDLLDTGVDDDNDYEDYTSRISTTTEETSVSRQYARRNRKRRQPKGYYNRNRMSRTSSLSSITESSMSLNIIQVTLNLDTVNYLGISLVGQTSKKGDGGIYVSHILKGGAVALDGRIEPGDMILQVNETNLENLTNDEAVEVIREAVKKPGPIKLLVAKCWDPHPRGHFTIPRSDPVRPIDPGAWVAHTEAARAKFTNLDNFPMNIATASNFLVNSQMSSSLPEQERQIFQPTPFASFANATNSYPMSATSVDTSSLVPGSPLRSSFKSGQNIAIAGSTVAPSQAECLPMSAPLTMESDLETIACAMASPNSGLDVRDRMWLKISIPSAFIGSDVVDWLYASVPGLHDRKDAKKLASKLLKEGYICHTINLKSSFSEKCYYIFSEQLQQINKTTVEAGDFSVVSQPLSNPSHVSQQPGAVSLPSNFDEQFSNALRLKNDIFDGNNQPATEQILSSNFNDLPAGSKTGAGARSKLPFMCYWDEKSEIRNYGLFGPQPTDIRNDGTNHSNHSGQYQSDEQMSQQSGQSILYNAQAATKTTTVAASNNQHVLPSNTIKSSNSNGSNGNSNSVKASNSNCDNGNIVSNSNNNLINHHYEDLQMNPITGNLVSTSSMLNNNNNSDNHTSQFRHVEGNDSNKISDSALNHNNGPATASGQDNQIGQQQQGRPAPPPPLPTMMMNSIALKPLTNPMRNSFKKAIGK